MADVDCFMAAIRKQESGGNYNAYNRGSGASGAYQFTDGTWRGALAMAGLGGSPYAQQGARFAPPAIQDAAARALMSNYYNRFGQSWYNVAEAWYGGPGAVGRPGIGGGPGYPNVGGYAQSVINIMNGLNCAAITQQGPPPPGPAAPDYTPLNDAWNWLGGYYNQTLPGHGNSLAAVARY